MTAAIMEALRERGFAVAHGPLDRIGYIELARQLGDLVAEESIALRPGAHAYVAKPGSVPLHTDHPEVDIIGWLCEAQDDSDGASLLLDTRPVVASLAESERETLRRVRLACPPLAGGPPTGTWPVLRQANDGVAVFCSPWLRAVGASDDEAEALERFRDHLSSAAAAPAEVQLVPGEALFVDNRRVLHGRRAIAESSRRRLWRVWLRLASSASSSRRDGTAGTAH